MKSVLALFNRPVVATLLTCLFVFAITMALREQGALEPLELMAYDFYVRLQPATQKTHRDIVIVEISEEDIQKQGRWPITDEVMTKILEKAVRGNPRAIGLDIFRDIPVPPGSDHLYSVLIKNKNIICVMKFGYGGVAPPPAVRGTEQVGFSDILVDRGGTVRRGLIFLSDEKNVYYSFPLRVAFLYLRKEGIFPQPSPENPRYLKLGVTTIPPLKHDFGGYINVDARGYQFLLDFKERGKWYTSYSLTEFLSKNVEPAKLKDKIVLVGMGEKVQSVKDFFYTPLSRGFTEAQQVPGVLLHGYVIDQLLRFAHGEDSPIGTFSEFEEALVILLWSLLGGTVGLFVRSPWRFTVVGTIGVLAIGFGAYIAFLYHYWIPSVPPALTWIFSASIVAAAMANLEKKERMLLMNLFSKHVSPEIAEHIWEQREQFLNAGRPRSQKLVVTVLFSDLRGFTSLSEKMDPQEHIEWLNTYMESMTRLIMAYGGVVDDYAGDGIKADFGVPFPRLTEDEIARDARNAVNCAVAMGEEIRRLNKVWEKQGLPTVGIRIGIYTGVVVAGALGSSQRLKYTTVGDTVNTAARLEGYEKNIAMNSVCRIFIGESTLRYLGPGYKVEKVGVAMLKGKDQPVTVYHVIKGIKQNKGL